MALIAPWNNMQLSPSQDDGPEGIHLIVRPVTQVSSHSTAFELIRLDQSETAQGARNYQGPAETSQQELAFICRQADGPEAVLVFLTVSIQYKAITAGGQPEGRQNESRQANDVDADGESPLLDLALRSDQERAAVDGLPRLRPCTSRDFERVAYPVFDAEEPGSPASSSDSLSSEEGLEEADVSSRCTSRSASPATTSVSRPPTRVSDIDTCDDNAHESTKLVTPLNHDDSSPVTEPRGSVQTGLVEPDQTRVEPNAASSALKLNVTSARKASNTLPTASHTVAPPPVRRSQRFRTSGIKIRIPLLRVGEKKEGTPSTTHPGSPSTQAESNTTAPKKPRNGRGKKQKKASLPSAPAGLRPECTFCGMSFGEDRGRLRHENSKHTRQRSWKCDECGKMYVRHDQTRRHLRDQHGIQEPRYTVVERLYTTDLDKAASGKEEEEE